MKRSDAVELIAKRLNPIGICDSTCDELIQILEEAGFEPPGGEWDPEESPKKCPSCVSKVHLEKGEY